MHRILSLLKSQVVLSGFYKALSGFAMFFSISLLLDYLGESDFGIWILIFTLFQWILLMDFGLSSVLKTKIPQLTIIGDTDAINAYIIATYKAIVIIAILVFLFFFVVINFVDIKEILNIGHDQAFIYGLFILNIGFFCINFIINTHKSLFVSILKGKFSEQSIAVNQIVFLICVVIIQNFYTHLNSEDKLYAISIANGVASIFVNTIYTVYFFITEKYSLFKPVSKKLNFIREIYRLGFQYMLSQLAIVFLFSSDGYILAYFYSPQEIVPYEIITRYFQFPLLIVVAAMAPLWSLFTKHYFECDKKWLKKAFANFHKIFVGILIIICVFTIVSPYVIDIWIKEHIFISDFLLLSVATTTALRIYTFFYIYFFNGIGKMNIYLLIMFISVVIKIPLSYLFISTGSGITGVVLATSVFLLIWTICFPIQAKKYINAISK